MNRGDIAKTFLGALALAALACGVMLVGSAMRFLAPGAYEWVLSQWLDIPRTMRGLIYFHDFVFGYMVIFGLALALGVAAAVLGILRTIGDALWAVTASKPSE